MFKSLFGKKEPRTESRGQQVEDPGPAAKPSVAVSAAGPAGSPIHVTDDTFEDLVLNAPVPVIVDFWAPWCGPCRMVAPIVEDLARDYEGRALIAKLNTDDNLQTAGALGIMGIPTLILFKDGEEVDRVVGYAPRHALEERLQSILS